MDDRQRDAEVKTLADRLPDALRVPGVSGAYRLGASLVALLMILLPLLYVAIIVGVGWAVWWHATTNVDVLASGGGKRGRLAAYVGPIAIGIILILFLVKPLFAPRGRRPRRVVLQRDQQPELFAFVERLCDAIGAPRPKEIHADCDLNASAGFHSGSDLLRGGRVLTIGMPLAAGMTLAQFSGVLAHEFGHFAQGTATRLSWIVATVNGWFARVVFERDAWDERLSKATKIWGWTSWIAALAKFCVWLTRKLLFALMWVARVVSSYLSRHMEYDADRYQIALIGSATTESAFRRLAVLGPLWGTTMRRTWAGWDERRLPENIPELLRLQDRDISDETRAEIERSLEEEKPALFATHPRLIDRIETARQAAVAGGFASDEPAAALFRDFDAVAREVTWDYYRTALHGQVKREYLVAAAALFAHQQAESADVDTMRRFTQNMPSRIVPVQIVALPAEPRATDLVERLRDLRAAVVANAEPQDRACQAVFDARMRRLNVAIAEILLGAKVRIEPTAFGLAGTKVTDRAEAREGAEADDAARTAEVRRLQAPLEERWALVLAVLAAAGGHGLPEPVAAHRDEVGRLLAVLACFTGLRSRIEALREQHIVLDALLRNLADHQDNKVLRSVVASRRAELAGAVREVANPLADQPYPFEHSSGAISIASYAGVSTAPVDPHASSFETAGDLIDSLDGIWFRCLTRLAVIGEAIESALGLDPLPAPAAAES